LVVLVTLIGLLLVLGLYIWHRRSIFQKNISIQRGASRLTAYQKAIIKSDKELETQHAPSSSDQGQSLGTSELPETEVKQLQRNTTKDDEDELLFVKLDKLVTRNKLFLNPDLSRDDLMRIIGVDKNRIGRIMSRYSGSTNVSTYINQKRAYYAADYIKAHPNYTIVAIVNACGMTNTVTFNRAFKELFGMTASEYREQMKIKAE